MSTISWQFTQAFGDNLLVDEPLEGDFVTAVEFSCDGNYVAVGDKAGRVRIYQGKETKLSGSDQTVVEYLLYTQFQSHEPEFDYLKSLEVEEKINMIKWLPPRYRSLYLLTTNDKTIKLWRIHERRIHKIADLNADSEAESSTQLRIPRLTLFDRITTASCKRVFAHAHAYHINSISINSDQETYISADDLRINLWNMEICDRSFNIVDIKPSNMEELTEVITSAQFHPQQCNMLMYSSSRGSIRIGDLREKALCDEHSKIFEVEEDPAERSFFSEIISSISDVNFTLDGRYMLARDYLTVKVWDINMESKPVEVIPVHDFIRSRLCDLYESDFIFDKFECSSSANGQIVVTGSYDSNFLLYNRGTQQTEIIAPPGDSEIVNLNSMSLESRMDKTARKTDRIASVNGDDIDFNRKVLHVGWHPLGKAFAVACMNNVYLYQSRRS